MNKIKYYIATCLLTIPILSSCSDIDKIEPISNGLEVPSDNVRELSIVDKEASLETKALLANLWKIQQKGFMFGHHDDLTYGRYWQYEQGNSDTKLVCGDYPAVYSVDLATIMDDRSETEKVGVAIRKRCIEEARNRGEVILACAHLNNPLTGGDSWDNSNKDVAKEILTLGSETQIKYNQWLDKLVNFLKNLKDVNGQAIPMIFRPFHEHTQDWSWWGKQCTTEDEFVELWRYTIDYLRRAGVHQLIYAISPQMDSPKGEDDFLFRWPGDDYVDFIGMDSYSGSASTFSYNMRTLQSVAAKKQKPCGVTETGVEGFTDKKFWTEQILAPAENRKVSMIVMWRNKFVGGDETDKHFYSIYPGHPSEKDFVRFYEDNQSIFSKDLPEMYEIPENIQVK